MSIDNEKISRLLPTRPKPISIEIEALEYASHIPVEEAVNALLENNYVVVADYYSSGLSVLEALKKKLAKRNKDLSFKDQRNSRNQYRTISHRLLLEVSQHQLTARKSPSIGWLKELYPETDTFFLPFPEVQGLNSSWQWHEKGIVIPTLNRKLHPYYGTYFPTRFEHIELFDKFLSQYKGNKQQVIDIGIGSGVLSLLMQEYGFNDITGTDSNPNALIGIHKLQESSKPEFPIKLRNGDLFTNSNKTFDLIVFNPPWVPVSRQMKGIDAAIYYDEQLFPKFFSQASTYLRDKGQLVMIFSNLGQLMNPGTIHPIEHELKTNNRFKKVDLMKVKVEKQSDKTKRTALSRDEELVELWVLESKQ